MIYKTMTKTRKNYVILRQEHDKYYVSCKLYGKRNIWEYTSYNHACYKFDIIHKEFIKIFNGNVLTNLK